MLNWIGRFFGAAVLSVPGIREAVRSALSWLWKRIEDILEVIRGGWGTLTGGIHAFTYALVGYAEEVIRGLWRIREQIIPGWIRVTVDRLTAWASRGLRWVRQTLAGALAALQHWAEAAVSWVRQRIEDVFGYLWARLSAVLAWVGQVGNRVADIVLHPDRLAAWILPALWSPLWRFIETHAAAIGAWLLRRALGATLRAAGIIETVLVRIL